jgi:hypothetical protein
MRYTSFLRHFHLPHLLFHSLQVQGILNITVPEGLILKSHRSEEGVYAGKYVKIPLNEESRGRLDSSELLKRDMREYFTDEVNKHFAT